MQYEKEIKSKEEKKNEKKKKEEGRKERKENFSRQIVPSTLFYYQRNLNKKRSRVQPCAPKGDNSSRHHSKPSQQDEVKYTKETFILYK